MKFSQAYKLGFDTETTGTDVKKDRIVTAAAVYCEPGGKIISKKTWIINPGIDIPEAASKIHGVTTEKAIGEGAEPKIALTDIAWTLFNAMSRGIPIVAFNLSFDWSILYHDMLRNGLTELTNSLYGSEYQRLVDPLVIDKRMHKFRKGPRKLGIMAEYYGVKVTNWHDASADAHVAILIAEKVFEKYWFLNAKNPIELYEQQRLWKKEQVIGLQMHHEMKQGFKMEKDYDHRWPLMD